MINRPYWLLKTQGLWLITAAVGIIGFRAALFSWRPAVLLVAVAAAGLVLTGFVGLLVLLRRVRAGQRAGSFPCLVAAGLGLPVLIDMLLIGMQGAKVPPIHDITTDPDNPPLFRVSARLRGTGDNPADYPGGNTADMQRQAYADIAPLLVTQTPVEAFDSSMALAIRLGWRIVGQDREQGLIEAVDRTLLFGFTDDIVIRIAAAGTGSRIDLRSASRAGVSDFGVNAKRIASFSATFNNLSASKASHVQATDPGHQ